MFKHEKALFHPVGVERPNPQYAALLQEQLGGGNGELKAAMQYMSQSFRIKDQKIKDLFLDIAAEELGHMEMVAQTINLLNGHDVDADQVKAGEIQTHVLLGLNPGLINASGYSWTGDYVTVTGDLCADLLSNIASEQRAKVVYEYLYRQIDDKKVRATIDFLLHVQSRPQRFRWERCERPQFFEMTRWPAPESCFCHDPEVGCFYNETSTIPHIRPYAENAACKQCHS